MIQPAWALNPDHAGHCSQVARTVTLPIVLLGQAVYTLFDVLTENEKGVQNCTCVLHSANVFLLYYTFHDDMKCMQLNVRLCCVKR